MTFGEKLYSLRGAAALSQESLAERLCVSRQAVSKWERGEAMPDVSKIIELSEMFSVTTDELLKGSTAEPITVAPSETSWQQFAAFAGTHWNCLGFIPLVIGVYWWIKLLLARISLEQEIRKYIDLLSSGFNTTPEEIRQQFAPTMRVILLNFILASLFVAAGCLVFFLGRHLIRKKALINSDRLS